MPTTLRSNLHGLLALLATWLSVGITGCALLQDLRTALGYWALVLVAPSVAILCFRWTLRVLPGCAKPLRICFWIGVVVQVLVFALLFQGKWEQPPDRHGICATYDLVVFSIIAIVIPSWLLLRLLLGSRKKEQTSVGWTGDAALAAMIVALLGAGGLILGNYYAAKIHAEGSKRWAEIGRPMPGFTKVSGKEENDSLKALAAELRPYGVASLYKAFTPKNSGAEEIPVATGKVEFASPEVIDLLAQELAPGDGVRLEAEKYPNLIAGANGLQELYQSILSRPAPVWEACLEDGPAIAAPNFLLLRKMTQTITADALLRIAQGDRQGAEKAAKAGLRLSDSLQENPLFVSFMIRVAIEQILMKIVARLPAEDGAWERLAQEAEQTRSSFKNLIQGESLLWLSWAKTHDAQRIQKEFESWDASKPRPRLPRWFQTRVVARPLALVHSGRNASFQAGMVEHWADQDFLTAPSSEDFGVKLYERYPSPLSRDLSRAWWRINMLLVLKEQAELIRDCRAQMAAGQLASTGSRPSVVIPGAKWEISAETAARSVALKLTPAPDWVAHSQVTDEKFFLLPVDGSRSWNFVLP